MIIYIPLCFYLYQFPYTGTPQRIFYLHSTMLLLILNPVIQTQTVNEFTFHYASTYTKFEYGSYYEFMCKIYIPLCFYLYRTEKFKEERFILIYIPLCFYLYYFRAISPAPFPAFTFHYASTYTPVPQPLKLSSFLFTFHYASTYTNIEELADCFLTVFTFHYASTYTGVTIGKRFPSLIFTFHYASTYTGE